MKFSQPGADIYLRPSSPTVQAALEHSTHLSIAAHQDDLEIMAYAGIAACYGRTDRRFAGVVVTNGAGSPRTGVYASLTDAGMQEVRREEQRRAAVLGDYEVCLQLAHPSAAVKDAGNRDVAGDLTTILSACRPQVLYLHNPADKHDTHVAVLTRCLEALRALPAGARPLRVLGCEVWRDLDWLPDDEKHALDASARPGLASALLAVFDSQISGGKRYDLAAIGRRAANATFSASHSTDQSTALTWAIDLTPLLDDPRLSLEEYTLAAIDRFRHDVQKRIRQAAGRP